MVPPFDANGLLPPGIHAADWNEFCDRYCWTTYREELLAGLREALIALRDAGCQMAYIDGSFITDKEVPGDFDGCWDVTDVDGDILDPVLLDFAHGRAAQKTKYLGELFPAQLVEGASGGTFLEFFQTDKESGDKKGIVSIALRSIR